MLLFFPLFMSAIFTRLLFAKKRNTVSTMTRKSKKLFLLACIVLIGTILLLRLLLPKPWQYTDTYHLIRVYMDIQDFPVQTEVIGGNNTDFQIKVDTKTIYEHLLKVRTIQDRMTSKDPVIAHYSPSMSLREQVDMMVTVETFVTVCMRANLTYFLWGGSLLGAYRHHGFIPWDDDFDLVMNSSDWRNIRDVLSRVQGYQLLVNGYSQWKFFKKDLPSVRGESFKWPFIDIFFFTEDASHVWSLTDSLKRELVNPKEDIFPVQFRPFEHLLVAVPCKTAIIVDCVYGANECRSSDFSHKDSKGLDPSIVERLPCSRLFNYFPFVFREQYPNSDNVIEISKIGGTILSNISVPLSCKELR
ncbi:uncharacterized protein LOC121383500 [Gigantopelta aegis]|uniref:uncharacterized protein LOC121383500 n=1 Tax=Gigantopelta aegis TaxID=1735272 RepID=UPI001B88E4D0|nr:uncharacterized protein LOC121383500 [Gigantopelta aegis]